MRWLLALLTISGCDPAQLALYAQDPGHSPLCGADGGAIVCGAPCGSCSEGVVVCTGTQTFCERPADNLPLDAGLLPGPTGQRRVFYVSNFEAPPRTDAQAVSLASLAARDVAGAVVLDRVYEVDEAVRLYEGVLYTGGGLRRACTPHTTTTAEAFAGDFCIQVGSTAGFSRGLYRTVVSLTSVPGYGMEGIFTADAVDGTETEFCSTVPLAFDLPLGADVFRAHSIAVPPTTNSNNISVDSVLFDGNFRCNPYTQDWRFNQTIELRGRHSITNSVFYDTPAENLTVCGARLEGNRAKDLQGSFIHKGCNDLVAGSQDYLVSNYIENANIAGDDLMEHSEGVFTFSNQAGNMLLVDNTLITGAEGVFGVVGADDVDVTSLGGCYAHFPHLIHWGGGADESTFAFDDVLTDVGPPIY